MNDRLRFDQGVTLIGAPSGARLAPEAMALAPALVCADGGANELGDLEPDAIIGDLDSLEDAAGWRRRLGARLIEVDDDQDSTDFEKCLARVDAPFFVGAGFLGGRIDHALAALHALVAEPRPVVLLGDEDVAVAGRTGLALALSPGDRVSIFPLRPVQVVSSSGLKWPEGGFSQTALAAGARIGTSNEASARRVEMRFDRPGAVVILPRARLGAALDAVSSAPGAR